MTERETFASETLPDGTIRIAFSDGIVIAHNEGTLTVKTPKVISVEEKEKSKTIPADAISALRPRLPVALKGNVTYLEDGDWLEELDERAHTYPESEGVAVENYKIACKVALDYGWQPQDIAECIINTEERMSINVAFGWLNEEKLQLIISILAADIVTFYPDEWKAAHINE